VSARRLGGDKLRHYYILSPDGTVDRTRRKQSA